MALTVAPPASVGDPRFDAFIAALVEHHLAAERLPIPDWTSDPSRRLDQAWVVDEWGSDDVTKVMNTLKAQAAELVALVEPTESAAS